MVVADMLPPSDIGLALVVVSLVLLAIAYAAVGLRLWSRHLLKRKIFPHDILCVSALICATGIVIMWIIGKRLPLLACKIIHANSLSDVYHGGLGQHGIDYATTGNPVEKLKVFGKVSDDFQNQGVTRTH
jgi:hypothetical protein